MLMVGWGLASMAMMLVHGSASFYVLRLLGGVAGGRFFPGCVLYLTYWFPNRIRGEILGFYYLGVPLALVLGGPLSGLLLDIPARSGLAGWQWMFLVEGFLAFAMGLASVLFFGRSARPCQMARRPTRSSRLPRLWPTRSRSAAPPVPSALLPMLRDPRVLRFVLMYAHDPDGRLCRGLLPAFAGLRAYAPAAGVCRRRRHRHPLALRHGRPATGCPSGETATAIIASSPPLYSAQPASPASSSPPPVRSAGLLMLCVVAVGVVAVQPLFWTMPTGYLADTAKAGGIALIGTGNLGGFIAPPMKVWAEQHFHSSPCGVVSAGRYCCFRRRAHCPYKTHPREKARTQAG